MGVHQRKTKISTVSRFRIFSQLFGKLPISICDAGDAVDVDVLVASAIEKA